MLTLSPSPTCRDQAYFVIRAGLNGMVLDIEGASRDDGANVVMWDYSGADNQLWYEDHFGLIRSKLNDFVLDASCESGFTSLGSFQTECGYNIKGVTSEQ